MRRKRAISIRATGAFLINRPNICLQSERFEKNEIPLADGMGLYMFGAEFVCSQWEIPSRKPEGLGGISRFSKSEEAQSFSFAVDSTPIQTGA
jgi:hypothetical protein